jgi:steroid delta-isomerase-like uncharacterized protein
LTAANVGAHGVPIPIEREEKMSEQENQEQQNKETLVRSLDLLTGKAGPELADEVYAADYLDHNAEAARGPGRVLRVAEQLRAAFPDLTYTVEKVIAEDDFVVLRMTMTGTHEGPLPNSGIPGTGRRISVKQMHMVRFTDGKISEHWALRDDLGMLRQLGLLPERGGAPARPREQEAARS